MVPSEAQADIAMHLVHHAEAERGARAELRGAEILEAPALKRVIIVSDKIIEILWAEKCETEDWLDLNLSGGV